MNTPCVTYRESTAVAGRCGNCGIASSVHGDRGDRARSLSDIADRLSDTFDPARAAAGNRQSSDGWPHEHELAIDAARSVLESRLTADVADVTEHWSFAAVSPITATEMGQVLAGQVETLRELEQASEDIESPDRQARNQLVKIAGTAIAFAEALERRFAVDRPISKPNGKATAAETDVTAASPSKRRRASTKRR